MNTQIQDALIHFMINAISISYKDGKVIGEFANSLSSEYAKILSQNYPNYSEEIAVQHIYGISNEPVGQRKSNIFISFSIYNEKSKTEQSPVAQQHIEIDRFARGYLLEDIIPTLINILIQRREVSRTAVLRKDKINYIKFCNDQIKQLLGLND